MIDKMEQQFQYMVYVSCMTFNHANYIKYALDGFCKQQTNFPFVCGILDDASTDGEPSLIQKYLEDNFVLENNDITFREETDDYSLIYSRHKTNINCHFAVMFLKYNHYQIKKSKIPYIHKWRKSAKYYALCEGDDYWIDPLKLQKQVDFLEQNSDYGLVHSLFEYVNQDSEIIPPPDIPLYREMPDRIKDGFIWHYQLTELNFILTCTVLYRSCLLTGEKTLLDFGYYAMLARQQKVFCIKEKMACYRINPEGMMRSQQGIVAKRIAEARLRNLYYYARHLYPVNQYYYSNREVFRRVAQASLLCIGGYKYIESPEKKKMMYRVLFGIKTNYIYIISEFFKKLFSKHLKNINKIQIVL